jgi:hypothetical protein
MLVIQEHLVRVLRFFHLFTSSNRLFDEMLALAQGPYYSGTVKFLLVTFEGSFDVFSLFYWYDKHIFLFVYRAANVN